MKRPGQGHLDLHQLARRLDLRRPGDLRHDAVHQARRVDDVLRDRDVDGLAAAHGRRGRQALLAAQLADPDPPAVGRVRGPVDRHRDPRPRDHQDAPADRRDLRPPHRAPDRRGPHRHGARPLLHARAGLRVRADRPGHRAPLTVADEPQLVAVGERVALGPIRKDLLDRYLRWVNDLEVRHGLANLGLYTPESEETWYAEASAAMGKREPEQVHFTIYDRSDEVLMDAVASEFEGSVLTPREMGPDPTG